MPGATIRKISDIQYSRIIKLLLYSRMKRMLLDVGNEWGEPLEW